MLAYAQVDSGIPISILTVKENLLLFHKTWKYTQYHKNISEQPLGGGNLAFRYVRAMMSMLLQKKKESTEYYLSIK